MIAAWAGQRLGRRLAVTLGLCLSVVSAVFLVMLVSSYRARLIEERSDAASQVNALLLIALENAMLKRDLDGLREMVDRLGRVERVVAVAIVDTAGEIRFAASPDAIGRRVDPGTGEPCTACDGDGAVPQTTTAFTRDASGREVLRSIHPVRNREACAGCHGPPAAQPINGTLIVDHDATGVRRAALSGAALLSGVGALVVLGAIGVLWLVVRRVVLRPIEALSAASRALADGDLTRRVGAAGGDEIAALGRSFDAMAQRLQASRGDLERRERFLQSLIDSIPDGLRVIDEGFVVRRANRAFLEQVGRTAAQVIGHPCHASSHGSETPCAPTLVSCPVVALRDGAEPIVCRHRHLRADGGEYFAEISAARLPSREAEERGLIVEVVRDLTREMTISHEQRLSEIGFLAAGVAHEIRNPLASVKLALGSRERDRGRGPDLETIEQGIDTCIEITERLLKLSAPPSLRPELVSLNTVVPDVISLLMAEARAGGIAVDLALDHGLRVVATDSDMRTLVLNLAQNAFHAMPGGGRLTIAGRIAGECVELAFADTGVGIPTVDLARIFDPFWSRRADGRRGTGLGLSICRAILRGCGGRIDVRSDVGRGTRFVVTVPWADRGEAAA